MKREACESSSSSPQWGTDASSRDGSDCDRDSHCSWETGSDDSGNMSDDDDHMSGAPSSDGEVDFHVAEDSDDDEPDPADLFVSYVTGLLLQRVLNSSQYCCLMW